MSRISILFCIDSVGEAAGTERCLAELIRRLDRTRFDVHLCCLADSPLLMEFGGCCHTQVLPVTQVFRPHGLVQVRRLRQYIDAQHIDIVHTFLPKATIVGVLAAKGSRAKAVITSRRSLGYYYTPLLLRLFRYLNRHTTRVLANCERVRRFTIDTERVPAQKVDVLYNGVDIARYGSRTSDRSALDALGVPPATVVGVVANYRPVKDLALFLRAARLVANEAPETVFLLIGDGPLRGELRSLAEELGIAGRVFFTGGRGEVTDYLPHLAVGCLSSSSEGFSNAILEYMASGLPVVATDVGGNAEAVEDGVSGYLVRERSPEAFAAPILRLLRDREQRAAMGRKSFERCREKFDLAGAIRAQERYYSALLEPAKPDAVNSTLHQPSPTR